ncbi:alpha-(1,3)-fucosyltransferase C-like [Ylistrum balloti]|uniref:alpha-(1,3)-fucosyltransferase C-like n=1 Tax=Ylistrum balloti TaxID=509963 RepID=UPI002905D291|nr:alpha-(1,3)-fucosyltransferase C-like [Ylistrum balloti]
MSLIKTWLQCDPEMEDQALRKKHAERVNVWRLLLANNRNEIYLPGVFRYKSTKSLWDTLCPIKKTRPEDTFEIIDLNDIIPEISIDLCKDVGEVTPGIACEDVGLAFIKTIPSKRLTENKLDMGKSVRVRLHRNSRKYLVTAVGLTCFVYLGVYNIITEKTYHNFCQMNQCDDNIIKFSQVNFVNKSTKKILLWTTYFTADWVYLGNMKYSKYDCSVTSDKSEIESADAVLFHYLDLWLWKKVPGYRRLDQVWIMYNMEAPPHQHYTGRSWSNSINWTLTYRSDSTVHLPYGEFMPLIKAERDVAFRKYSNKDFFVSKTKMIVAAISDCPDDAKRYRHISELEKYVNIDFYGKCGNLACSTDGRGECDSKTYKFRIAFENANCQDYVTEKFWRSLYQQTIPIVNWKVNQIIEAPPHSYINIYDFDSIKELSEYLYLLSSSPTLYNEYFAWKTKYKPTRSTMYRLCDALHTPRQAQTIIDPRKWMRTDSCSRWSVGI